MNKGFTHESTYNESVEWYTPRSIFDSLGIEFDLDPASPGKDIVPWISAKRHLTIEDSGLLARWEGNIWLNPPYGDETPDWLGKLANHGRGIALLFTRPDTRWFHRYVPLSDAICLVKGRIGFIHEKNAKEYAAGTYEQKGRCGAASMLIAYGKDNAKALYESKLGLTLVKWKDYNANVSRNINS